MKLKFKFTFLSAMLLFTLHVIPATSQNLSSVINSNIPASGLNLTLNSVVLFGTATGPNLSAMRDSVFKNWVYPDGLVVGPSAKVSNVYKMGQQTGLDTARVAQHMFFLSSGAFSLQTGYTLYQCSYTLIDSTNGTFNFTTIGYEDAGGNAVFEPFMYMCPLHHSDYIKTTKPGAAHDVEFDVRSASGLGASGWGDCKITCSGETVIDCFGLVGGDADFLWDYEITKDCATVGKCCRCIFRFGFASGFTSVGVGVDGVSIELSGSFGWKGSTEAVVKRCCPTGAVVAFNFVPQNSGTSTYLTSVSAVSESTGWISGTGPTVLKTTNGGSNWINVSAGLSGDIYNINAIDANTAFCTSSPAGTIIFKTSNGGAQWIPVFNQPGGFIDAIQMISPTTGYALGDPVGGKWTVLRTTNSGNTWQRMATEPVQIGAEGGWQNSFRILGNHIWFGTNSNRVYHSSDLGVTWNSAVTPGVQNSYAVHYNSHTTGLVGGTGMALSTNSGLFYSHATTPGAMSEVYGIEGFANEWWGVGTSPNIYMSGNNGASWSSVYTYTLEFGGTLTAIDFSTTGDVTGWIAGSAGEIIKMSSSSVETTLGLTVLLEAQYSDTVSVYLRNNSSPYALVDSAKGYIIPGGNVTLNYPHASAGNYYIVVKHRNSIETWSAAGQSFSPGSVTNYDFTTSSSQSYGGNLVLVTTEWCVYTGDVNQDGSVTLSDVLDVYNAATSFATGYIGTDVNGDLLVDLNDVLLTYNNASNFVAVISP